MKDYKEIIKSVLQENSGFITSTQATNAGVPRRCLSEMLLSGEIYKVDRGIYALPNVWEDEMFFLQYRFGKGVYSHGTALYLHKLTDRTPSRFTMTFRQGYNASGAKEKGLLIKLATSDLYEFGISEALSPCGNKLRVYDIERTLCDIVRGKSADDIQLVSQAMKLYAQSKNKNIPKLIEYAEKLRVKSKILNYMEVLL